MLLAWAFGSGTLPSKVAWAKAVLIRLVIVAEVGFSVLALVGTAFYTAMGKQ